MNVDSTAASFLTPPVVAHGQPIIVLLNIGSGSLEKDEAERQIRETLETGGREVTIVRLAPPQRIPALIAEAVVQAKASRAILVAAGGDGTLNTVAQECRRHKIPMGIIPLGTFNYFARHMGIPLDPAEAAKVLLDGKICKTDVGFINEHLFINNASFGLYSRLIKNREQDKARFGRFRLVALLSAVKTLFRGQRPFAIRVVTPQDTQLRRTEMVYVCNNPVQLENIGLPMRECVMNGRLAVLVLKPLKFLDRLRLLWNGLVRNLGEDERLEAFCAKLFDVDTRRRAIDVVVDGEVVRCATPLSFRVERYGLQVMVPLDEAR